jgi:septal ring factor EnvC (AmiA/AmiB activator)
MENGDVNEFKSTVKRYLQINEHEEKLKEEMKQLKNEKDSIENNIMKFMENNNITDRDIDVGDFKLKYSTSKKTEGVTKKLIYERLVQFLNNEQKAKELLDFIYQERNSEMINSIKLSAKK